MNLRVITVLHANVELIKHVHLPQPLLTPTARPPVACGDPIDQTFGLHYGMFF